MSWVWLVGAIVTEVMGTTSMKLSAGMTKIGPTVALFVFYVLSLTCLTFALKRIDVSVAYAIWSGLGTMLIACIGVAWFGEAISAMKVASIVLIIAGVVGLNLSGAGH